MQVRRGRPRSDHAHRAVLEATRDLLLESGYEALSFDAIAARAGVGRQTIHRWWSSKTAIITEAVLTGLVSTEISGPPDTGDVAADLRAWWTAHMSLLDEPRMAGMVRGLTAGTAQDAEEARRLYDRYAAPLRTVITARLRVAVEAGQLRDLPVLATIPDVLLGTLLYRLLSSSTHDADTQLIDLMLFGVAVEGPGIA
ncbi:TetR/AcrR family transcriptional regulator [Nocardia sp. NPDC057227]|uniref:TetR/AcrR family transcriptional regulator n=1 Tax=Nocardia sp. NPDC057227 TaxID=3346056 RepID=UPI003642F2D6